MEVLKTLVKMRLEENFGFSAVPASIVTPVHDARARLFSLNCLQELGILTEKGKKVATRGRSTTPTAKPKPQDVVCFNFVFLMAVNHIALHAYCSRVRVDACQAHFFLLMPD